MRCTSSSTNNAVNRDSHWLHLRSPYFCCPNPFGLGIQDHRFHFRPSYRPAAAPDGMLVEFVNTMV